MLTEKPTQGGKVKRLRIDLEKSEDWLQVGASMVEYSKDGYIFYVPIRFVSFIGTRALEVDEFARDVQRELRQVFRIRSNTTTQAQTPITQAD